MKESPLIVENHTANFELQLSSSRFNKYMKALKTRKVKKWIQRLKKKKEATFSENE